MSNAVVRKVTYITGRHRFVIRYQPGDEQLVGQVLDGWVKNPRLPFDADAREALSLHIRTAISKGSEP